MGVSRRHFLNRIGAVAGVGATYAAMQALGLSTSSSYTGPPQLGKPPNEGSKIVVLGAGIAGLVAAYEMRKVGWDCTVLEAQERAGGRNWSIRRGENVRQLGFPDQLCEFDRDLYFNAGAARIPGDHRAVLDYCRELGVSLEVAVTHNANALIRESRLKGGLPLRQQDVVEATRAGVSQLLAKVVQDGTLSRDLTISDVERLRGFLRLYAGEATTEKSLSALDAMNPLLWKWLLLTQRLPASATMFQPAGGMDRLSAAFASRIHSSIRYRAEVQEIRKRPSGVRIVYRNASAGRLETLDADYCICSLPWPVLRLIPADFSQPHRDVIESVEFESATKIAWQSARFWERDNRIFGGSSYTGDTTAMIWYPSEGMNGSRGILLGAYTTGIMSALIASRSLEDRYEISRLAVEKLHPRHGGELTHPCAVSWCQHAWSRGAWAKATSPGNKQRRLDADGRIFFAGDQVTELSGWQEGAVLSAHRAIQAIEHRAWQ